MPAKDIFAAIDLGTPFYLAAATYGFFVGSIRAHLSERHARFRHGLKDTVISDMT